MMDGMDEPGFYEDDEPVADVIAAFEAGEHGLTGLGGFVTFGVASRSYVNVETLYEHARGDLVPVMVPVPSNV
jgi:hypothetical protein